MNLFSILIIPYTLVIQFQIPEVFTKYIWHSVLNQATREDIF